MRVLHAIHDFLPRHQAGSEVYAANLCRALQPLHDVSILCAEFDPARPHGQLAWRVHDDIPIIEIANNWACQSFEETYRSPVVSERIQQVVRAVQPDVVHVHNLLNLSFDLPRIAQDAGIPVVATLHDYTLVCPSGGQRIHRAEQHVCHVIDVDRCARCFVESPFHALAAVGSATNGVGRRRVVSRIADGVRRHLPWLAVAASRVGTHVAGLEVTPADISTRLAAASEIFQQVDLFVAPSSSIADEYRRLGLPDDRLRVLDYGFPIVDKSARRTRSGVVRIGYVGSLVWHKGVHVLLEAVRQLPATGWELHVHGDPRVAPDYVAELRIRAAGLPVHFRGTFGRNHASEVYGGLDLLVVPSIWLENSPLVIHEAAMAGVPIVGARIGGISDLIVDGQNGRLYDPSSASALSAILRSLIAQPERLAEFDVASTDVRAIADDAAEWGRIYQGLSRSPDDRVVLP